MLLNCFGGVIIRMPTAIAANASIYRETEKVRGQFAFEFCLSTTHLLLIGWMLSILDDMLTDQLRSTVSVVFSY